MEPDRILTRHELNQYIKKTEKMVSPGEVGKLHQRAEMLRKLPIRLQKFIIETASSDPTIAFVVEPYSFFLSYEIQDLAAAEKYIPPHYRLVPCAMFDGTEPRYCAILGIFNVHTSVFWGSRVELYVIAEDIHTGLLSWIICDYESNTISYDPASGFLGPSTKHSVVTTSYAGELIVDVAGARSGRQITLTADIKAGVQTPLTQRLWVEGNLSVDYGGELEEDNSIPFGLVFDPQEMAHALKIPLDSVDIEANTFDQNMVAPAPFEALCFPFAQHFLTSSFPIENAIRDAAGLESAIQAFNQKES